MKVYVTHAQFDVCQRLRQRYDSLGDPADLHQLGAQLTLAAAENGGSFNIAAALAGMPTELVILRADGAQNDAPKRSTQDRHKTSTGHED